MEDANGNVSFSLKLTSKPTDSVSLQLNSASSGASILVIDVDSWDEWNEFTVSTDTTITVSSNDTQYSALTLNIYFTDSGDTVKINVEEGGTTLDKTITPTIDINSVSDAFPDENQTGEVSISLSEATQEDLTLPFNVSGTTNPGVSSNDLESLLSFENAVSLDGEDDYITVNNSTDFDFGNSFTMEAYVRVDSFSKAWETIISKGNTWQLSRNNETSTIYFGNSILSVSGSTNIDDGKWHHVAGVYTSRSLSLYIDGELDGFEDYGSASFDSSNSYNLLIGANEEVSDRNFQGEIDEVRIWNTARTQENIQAGMFQSLSGSENGLEIYYSFDESSVNDTTISDLTGQGYDGTLTNGDSSNFVASNYQKGLINIASGQDASTIAIAGINDGTDEGDESVTVSLESGDNYYLDLNYNEATITIDYEEPGVAFAQFSTVGNLNLSELASQLLDIELAQFVTTDSGENIATFNVALAQQPTADVTLTFDDANSTAATFTTDNWDENQQLTITTQVDDTDSSVSISSTDSTYNNQTFDLSISTSIIDISFDNNDSTLLTSEDGDSVDFCILLETAPT